ncbi:MAG TPA: cobalt ABC transporter ATP-binding protein [Ruminococcus sp.]|nr:cobalt ABC transporter ATP-binding protein [Ruminococcus sp.]
MALIQVSGLSFRYPGAGRDAVRDVTFSMEKGEFAVLCGASGCGKSTLLRMIKRELSPLGERTGEIRYREQPLESLSDRESASAIGFVMQKPEQQIVTDKVWHELAFGAENTGIPAEKAARRIAETASWFGIGQWYERDTAELSGGQKQLLNLASVLVMQPELVILDEPTAQLDPIAASEFITAVRRLNQELGITILMAEHRLEEAVPGCDRLMVMECGELIANGKPGEVIGSLRDRPELLCGMPAASRLHAMIGAEGECPLTVRQGRELAERYLSGRAISLPERQYTVPEENALEFSDVFFRYSRYSPDVLKGLSFSVGKGELFCILGGNGSGKTTALSAAAALVKPYSGTVRVFGKKLKEYRNQSLYRECLALLPQDVQTVFLKSTVREELKDAGITPEELPYDLTHLLDMHPYDLSGGEQQLAALAKVLAQKPKLLLLDEPTKGLDAAAKQGIIKVLRSLRDSGVTVVTVTHDVEFAAGCADRCAMFFNGRVVSVGTPAEFFPENSFYTTAAVRMTRGLCTAAVTVEDAAELCRMAKEDGI